MDISFIVLTWNSERHIARSLESLIADLSASGRSYEIFAVDNGSSDSTAGILGAFAKQYPDSIKIITFAKNTGTTISRNCALKLASGAYIGIMDSDVEVAPGTVNGLIAALDSDPRIGLVAPKLQYPDGRLQKSFDRFPTFFSKTRRYLFLKAIERQEAASEPEKERFDVDYAISALWLLKRAAVNVVGLFDERIFYSPEDVDYCLRMWKAGYRVVCDQCVVAVHHAQEISRGFRPNKAFFLHLKGLFYYFAKHRYWLKSPVYIR